MPVVNEIAGPQQESDAPTDSRGNDKRGSGRLFVIWLTIIISAGFAIRLMYLFQIESIPFFYALVSDAESYYAWAERISLQDFWGRAPFYQAPAYPYFLAATKSLVGHDLFAIRVVQAGMSAIACGFLGLAGRAFHDARSGLWAAGLLAVYGPSIYAAGLIQKTTLGEFLICLVLALLGAQLRRPRALLCMGLGIAFGLLALTRENVLVLIPLLMVWLSLRSANPGIVKRATLPTLMLLGMVLTLAAPTWHNYRHGGGLSITTVQAGPNFFIGNNPQATGLYRPLVPGHETPIFEQSDAKNLAQEQLGRPLSDQEVSNYWMHQSWNFIRSDFLSWLRLMGRKWLLVWNAYEIPDTAGLAVFSSWSWLLGLLNGVFHFGILVPLGVSGAVLTIAGWRRLWVLYGMVLLLAMAVALFFVFGRYRYPLVPLMALFAGAGLVELSRAWRQSKNQRWSTALISMLAVSAVVNWPISTERELDAIAWGNLGTTLARQEKIGPAIVFLEQAVQGAPGSAEMRFNLGQAYARVARLDDAVEQLKAAKKLKPDLAQIDFQLGVALERQGRTIEALKCFEMAQDLDPSDEHVARAINRLRNQPPSR